MVDHLISDAMADAFDITIRREPVDVAALVNEVAEANQPLAVNKQQAIAVSAPPNIVTMCDTDRIREAIDNLISNAIKYSPIGGKIAVAVSHEDDNTIIRVTDQGAGLSPEDLGRLFGRFQRLSAKPTAGESSTGLGLSIVKRIIDMHGGEVTAASPGPGQGLDLHRHPARGRAVMTQSQHIIIVDDEAPAREMVGDYLQDARLHRDAVRRRQEPARRDRDRRSARSRGARPQHARGRRPLDHPRPQEPHQRPRHHADRDRKPDRPRGRARARRRRLCRQALRAARTDGAHPLGAAAKRARPRRRRAAAEAAGKAGKEQLVRFGTKWLDLEAQALRDDEGNEHPLTASEFGLLKVFAANPKRVLSRERLLELANARDSEAFDRAVDLRIMRIRRKIEPDPTKPAVIRTIRGGGYLFSPAGDKA